jgi:hypothetical protein
MMASVVSISEAIEPAFCSAVLGLTFFLMDYDDPGEQPNEDFRMSQMTPEVSKLLQQALSLTVEEQEALADSLISNLGGKVDEGVLAAWDEEIRKRIADLDSGRAKPFHGRKFASVIWRSCLLPTKSSAEGTECESPAR